MSEITVKEKTDCRLCGGKVRKVFELAPTPIANNYQTEPDEAAERYPLELMQCEDCDHVQQRYVITGLFKDYKYQTPQTVATYLEPVAKRLKQQHPEAKRVLEIGCNNGVFLDVLIKEGFWVIGIDPAADHVNGIRECFTEAVSRNLMVKFDLVVANNVFAHIDDLADVFRGINNVLTLDGAIVFEVQYLPDLIRNGEFDMIYHEHLDYHHLKPLARFLTRMGFTMVEWEHIRTHGGSMRITAKRHGKEAVLPEEKIDWRRLQSLVDLVKKRMKDVADDNAPLVAFGATAKATTLIHNLGIADKIAYCVDSTPQKQGRYIPGTNIKILPVSELKNQTVLLTAWNYEREIRQMITNKLINPFR